MVNAKSPHFQSQQLVRPAEAAQQTAVSVCSASLATPAATNVATTACAAQTTNTTGEIS